MKRTKWIAVVLVCALVTGFAGYSILAKPAEELPASDLVRDGLGEETAKLLESVDKASLKTGSFDEMSVAARDSIDPSLVTALRDLGLKFQVSNGWVACKMSLAKDRSQLILICGTAEEALGLKYRRVATTVADLGHLSKDSLDKLFAFAANMRIGGAWVLASDERAIIGLRYPVAADADGPTLGKAIALAALTADILEYKLSEGSDRF